MKKAILHIVITFFALNVITFNNFSRAPLMVIHYLDHAHRNHEINFSDFLSMHYWGKDIKDNDDQQDQQLPFKNFNPDIQSISVLPNYCLFNSTNSTVFYTLRHFAYHTKNSLPSWTDMGLLRPPQC